MKVENKTANPQKSEVKSIYYCKECHNLFSYDRIIVDDNICPVYTCTGENIQEVDERIFHIINLLNNNNIFVNKACFTESEICIELDGEYEFKSLPKGFDVSSYEDYSRYYENGECPDGVITEVYYVDVNSKTDKELSQIIKDMEKWARSLYRPLF